MQTGGETPRPPERLETEKRTVPTADNDVRPRGLHTEPARASSPSRHGPGSSPTRNQNSHRHKAIPGRPRGVFVTPETTGITVMPTAACQSQTTDTRWKPGLVIHA